MLNRIVAAPWTWIALIALTPGVLFADTVPPPTTAPTSQPTLIAHPSAVSFVQGSAQPRIVLGREIVEAPPDGCMPGQCGIGSALEFGFATVDQTLFFAVQTYGVNGSVDALNADQLAPAAIEQLHGRWAGIIADDAPIQVQHDSKYALELHYSMHLCHGVVPLVDSYGKVGRVLMRVTVIPMSQSLTPEQFTALSASADKITATIISSARPYNEAAESHNTASHKEVSLKQRTNPVMPVANTVPTNSAHPAPTVAGRKSGKEAEADKQIHRAELALAQAQKLKDDGKNTDAYERFKFVAKEYAQTPSADAAKQAVAAFEADPAFMAKYNAKSPASQPIVSAKTKPPGDAASKARALLSLADSYASADEPDMARKKYQAVIDQFPNTPQADTAKQKLASMKN